MHARHRKLKRVARSVSNRGVRLGRIYVAGIRPAVGFGASVNGFSDYELLKMRRVVATSLAPNHGGASLTGRLAMHGDVCWTEVVAPALQWAKVLWRVVVEHYHLDVTPQQIAAMLV